MINTFGLEGVIYTHNFNININIFCLVFKQGNENEMKMIINNR